MQSFLTAQPLPFQPLAELVLLAGVDPDYHGIDLVPGQDLFGGRIHVHYGRGQFLLEGVHRLVDAEPVLHQLVEIDLDRSTIKPHSQRIADRFSGWQGPEPRIARLGTPFFMRVEQKVSFLTNSSGDQGFDDVDVPAWVTCHQLLRDLRGEPGVLAASPS